MRNTSTIGLLLGALCVAAVGCGGEEPAPKAPETTAAVTPPPPPAPTVVEAPPPPPKPTMAEMQMKAGQNIIEGWNAHDSKKILDSYASDAVMKGPGMPEQKGKEAMTAGLNNMFTAMPDLKAAPRFVFMKNDVVVVVIDMVGTHKGDLMGIPATNKPVGYTAGVVQWYNTDGLVKEEHVYMDAGTVMSQIGVSKQKVRGIPTLGAVTAFNAKNNDQETKNVDAVKLMYTAFEKKSVDGFIGTLAEGAEWDDMTQADTYKGTAAAKKYFTEASKAFPDAKNTVANSWGIDEFVVTESTFSGTQKGAFMGMKASNKAISMDSLDVVRMKDGKIVKGWSFGNGMQVAAQLGLLPKPGAKPAAKPAPAGKPAAKPAPAPKKK